jgi:predicted DCC family thiol-disulfide oxidoreductase YuxK
MPLLLYDGVCGLCNRFVQFILRHDRDAGFKFASLQSPLATRILSRHAANPSDLDTVYVVLNHELPDERLLSRSDAVIFVLKQLGTPWAAAASLMQLLPRFSVTSTTTSSTATVTASSAAPAFAHCLVTQITAASSIFR